MGEDPTAVRLAGMELDPPCHAWAFFYNRQEQYAVLLPFAQERFARGEKGLHIDAVRHRQKHSHRLTQLGIDVPAAERTGQTEMRACSEAHLWGGRFDQYAMLALVEEVLTGGKASGFGLTGFWANTEWPLEESPGVYDLVEYKIRLNYVLPKYDDAVVCTYDLTRFNARVVIDILCTHPMVIICEIMQPVRAEAAMRRAYTALEARIQERMTGPAPRNGRAASGTGSAARGALCPLGVVGSRCVP